MRKGHIIACHLTADELNAMEPVIEVEALPAAG
jgi:hypothetical protein